MSQPGPTPEQQHWMDLKFGLFLHFGINTYYDLEWSDGTLDPAAYNPAELDTDQWCRAAREAGAKFVVLVTKHHDGFCNWPTELTDYSVRATPWKGDLVGELVQSARKHDLEVGLYYSLWDRHEKTHDEDEAAYAEFMKGQLRELLTGYGDIVELWFDGMWKKQQTGWQNGEEEFMAAWRDEGAPRWRMEELYALIKELQPGCMVLNNTTTRFPGLPLFPCDARPGEKAQELGEDRKVWEYQGREVYLPLQIETTLSQKGPEGKFQSGSWFWHDWDHTVASQEQIRSWLKTAESLDAVLLLNAGPMANGKLRPEDYQALTSLRS
jgi:alpha-L-fucosidase